MPATDPVKADIRAWWAASPMTYAEDHGATEFRLPDGGVERVEIGTHRFFQLSDQTFYRWNESLHTDEGPFGRIFDYAEFRGKRVLEIGCGLGCMAMNWAMRGAKVTAIDLNPVAVDHTRRRFSLFDLDGSILEADAERLPFKDQCFDFVYSWGVLHHTRGIGRAIGEIRRTLAPGGRTGLMLYNRHSLLYRYMVAYQEGLVHAESCFLDQVELASRYGDGARAEGNPHTWPVTEREVRRDLLSSFEDVSIRRLGTDVPDVIDTWAPRLSRLMAMPMRKALARRFGWSLWITARRPD